VFLDLWNNRFNYDPNLSDFTTYAYNRGRGVVKSMLQAHGRIGRVRKKITLENRKGYLNQSLESENKEICNALMSLLSVEERRILGMRFLQDIPVNEIAQNLNLNPQKIYAIIREAKLKCITSKWNLE
jgi:RNA polymerase sigma factor (sigma-70 family)